MVSWMFEMLIFTQELFTHCAQFPSVYNVKVRYIIWDVRSYFSSVLFAPGRMCAQKKKKNLRAFLFLKVLEESRKGRKYWQMIWDWKQHLLLSSSFIYVTIERRKNKIYFKKLFSNAPLTFHYLLVITEKNMLFSLYCDINLALYLLVV